MGQEKALLSFRGEPLIARVIHRLQKVTDEILIVTNNPERFAFLGMRCVRDKATGTGAMGGLHAALQEARGELVAVVACDMPFLSADVLKRAAEVLMNEGVDAVLPCSMEGLEPLHAVYRRSTCLPVLEEAVARGERRLVSFLPFVRVRELMLAEMEPVDPYGRAFINVNTPEEWRIAEKICDE